MADEITAIAGISLTKGELRINRPTLSAQFDMAGDAYAAGVQDIGFAAHEILDIGGAAITTAGWAWFRNLDATNFVQLGVDVAGAFHAFGKLLAGEFALVPLATLNIYAKADTAAVKLQYEIVER